MLIFFLIIGVTGLHTTLGLLAVLGEAMMIRVIALSTRREKGKRKIIIQEVKEKEKEKWYISSEFKEIILGLSGFILALTVSIILTTLEYDFW